MEIDSDLMAPEEIYVDTIFNFFSFLISWRYFLDLVWSPFFNGKKACQ